MKTLKMYLVACISLMIGTAFIHKTEAPQKRWKSLFDGKSFAGWHVFNGGAVGDKWAVEDGTMHLLSKGGGDIVTDAEYENFILELEWKISEGGNSGVMWGVIEDKKYCCPYVTGPEMQVLDDAKHPDSFAGKNGNHKAGSLYDMIPPSDTKVVKPAGEWNKAKMQIKSGKGTFWLNGVQMVSFPTSGDGWKTLVADSKFKKMADFGRLPKGRIAIQDHGDQVWFRNIRIKEL
jgi:Domain of Unknown Function (DUF1080)